MREIDVSLIKEAVKNACIEINYTLSPDMNRALRRAYENETYPLAKEILSKMKENLEIASDDFIPICQDTGMITVFMDIGQDVHFVGGYLNDSVNEGVKLGYKEGFLRKSVVRDPIDRINTNDNTPAIIHTNIDKGDKVTLTVTAKGFGSENTSRIFMLKPSDGVDGIKSCIVKAVREAGANACPPMVVGVGIGGNFEKCAIMAKHALTRDISCRSEDGKIAELEKELLDEINTLNIGPAGLKGDTTAYAVNIETYPTHIAGLPLAVNICCHVNRHKTVVI